MSEDSSGPVELIAAQVSVQDANGVRIPGWAVRQDVVVTHAGGLQPPLTAVVNGDPVEAEVVHEATIELDSEQPWTALELPEGSIAVQGERFPPGLAAGADDRPGFGARRAFWCIMFPQMRGCR